MGQTDDSVGQFSDGISRLYGRLKIRSVDDIPESDYFLYKKFVSDSTVNVMVHPAYFLFFQDNNDNKVFVDRGEDFSKNIVDLFIEEYPAEKRSMPEQMKLSLKNEELFLRDKSQKRELLVLVLPPRYKKHPEYPYKKLDEFARYLNEVTHGSPSVLYVESDGFKNGYLSSDTHDRLSKFFNALGINTVRIGGGYKDLCVKNFYDEIVAVRNIRNTVLVPEICTVSPDLINH